MELTIFAKNRETKDGKKFTNYITKLTRKDGTEFTASVKFKEECGSPKKDACPCNIIVAKDDANLATRTVTDDETGKTKTFFTLWVSDWKNGTPYVDHSLDDIDF